MSDSVEMDISMLRSAVERILEPVLNMQTKTGNDRECRRELREVSSGRKGRTLAHFVHRQTRSQWTAPRQRRKHSMDGSETRPCQSTPRRRAAAGKCRAVRTNGSRFLRLN